MPTSAAAPGRRLPRIRIGALGLVTIVAYGVAYYSYGALIDPIKTSTGWSSTGLGAAFSTVLVLGGAGGLFGGRLVDRLGTRPAFLIAATLGAGSIAAASLAHSLLAFGALYAIGGGAISALGFYHITQPPASLRSATGSAQTKPHDKPTDVRRALADAWQAPAVRRWVLATMISCAAVDVVLVYQVPIMIAAGLPVGLAATIGGLRGFAQVGGRLPLSPLLHKIGTKATLVTALIVALAAVLLLLASRHLGPAIGYSLLGGASIGALYTLQGIYTNELVGHQNLSLLMGAQQAVFAIGGALGPVIAGAIFQAGNSYTPVVLLTATGFLISALILSPRAKTQRRPRRCPSPSV